MILSRTLTLRFEHALEYAVRKHRNQRRKGTRIPYVAHLLGVASIALSYGADEDEAIAALLHDAVEDQGGRRTREEISKNFGEAVAAIVDGCTDADRFPKPPWRKRKEAYIEHMKVAQASVLLVSGADKLDNARAILMDYREISDKVWSRFKGRREGTLWYYREMVKALRSAKHAAADKRLSPLFDELARVVSELDSVVGA
jgi:(p)ppGpp synthase/HD superfamily hydrolase